MLEEVRRDGPFESTRVLSLEPAAYALELGLVQCLTVASAREWLWGRTISIRHVLERGPSMVRQRPNTWTQGLKSSLQGVSAESFVDACTGYRTTRMTPTNPSGPWMWGILWGTPLLPSAFSLPLGAASEAAASLSRSTSSSWVRPLIHCMPQPVNASSLHCAATALIEELHLGRASAPATHLAVAEPGGRACPAA